MTAWAALSACILCTSGCGQSVEDCMHDKRQLWEGDAEANKLEGSPEFWDALADCKDRQR